MQNKPSLRELPTNGLWTSFQRLSPGRKFMLAVISFWLIQATPKWTAAFTADGEVSAQIMKTFVTPRTVAMSASEKSNGSLMVDSRQVRADSGQRSYSF